MLGAVLAAAVILAALYLPSLIHPGGGSPETSPPQTFFEARGVAQSAANESAGAGAIGLVSWGVSAASTVSVPFTDLTNATLGTGCGVVPGPSVPAELTIGGGNVSNGNAGGWFFLFRSPSLSYLFVGVIGPRAVAYGNLTGPHQSGIHCLPWEAKGAIPANVPDSPTAATAINAAGGRTFLAAHTSANGVYVVEGPPQRIFPPPPGPAWVVGYTSCPVGATISDSGDTFLGVYSLTLESVTNTTLLTGSHCLL